MEMIQHWLLVSWGVMEDSALFLLAGFFLAGLVKEFLPMDLVKSKLGRDNLRSVFNASLIGVPLPLCSCSVLPAAASLRKSGAGKGATTSFLISTPETGVDSIAISLALLDPVMAVFRPVAAFFTAMAAGVGENLFGDPKAGQQIELDDDCHDGCCSSSCPAQEEERPAPERNSFSRAMNFAFGELMDDLAGWLLAGILAAGLVAAVTPDRFFEQFAGHGFLTMVVMLFAGIPMYICATASTPLAAALMLKGLSPGAALVFLLSGPATNIGSLMIIRKLMGGRSLAIYLGAIAAASLGMGLVLDAIYIGFQIDPVASLGQAAEIAPRWLQTGAAILFSLLMLRSFAGQARDAATSLAQDSGAA